MLTTIRDALHTLNDVPKAMVELLTVGFTSPISVGVSEHPLKLSRIIYWSTDGWKRTELNVTTVQSVFASVYSASLANQKAELFLTLNSLMERYRERVDELTPRSLESYVAYLKSPQFRQHDLVQVQDVIRIVGEHWVTLLTERGFPKQLFERRVDDAWIRDLSYYKWFFTQLLTPQQSTIDQWRAWVEFSILYHTSFDFFPKLPSNVLVRQANGPNPVDRGPRAWKRATMPGEHVTEDECLMLTEEMLPGIVSKHYQVDASTTDRVKQLTERLRGELISKVSAASMLANSNATRDYLVNKVRRIHIRVGGANHLWQPETFPIVSDRYMQNLDYIRRDRVQRDWNGACADCGRDSAQRFGAPLTFVNAMYSPLSNSISIFDGILQYPFIHSRFSDASLLGTIGTVIAHEMGHALGET